MEDALMLGLLFGHTLCHCFNMELHGVILKALQECFLEDLCCQWCVWVLFQNFVYPCCAYQTEGMSEGISDIYSSQDELGYDNLGLNIVRVISSIRWN